MFFRSRKESSPLDSLDWSRKYEVFMYGKYARVDPTKNETYKQWERDPDLFGELQLTFQDAIALMFFEILLPVAEASKHELGYF